MGKPVGIVLACLLAVRFGLGRLPAGVTWSQILGLGITAGIGFTVALYVTSLSFADPLLTSSAKLGVLAASAAAGMLGYVALRLARPTPPSTPPIVHVEDPRNNARFLDMNERRPTEAGRRGVGWPP